MYGCVVSIFVVSHTHKQVFSIILKSFRDIKIDFSQNVLADIFVSNAENFSPKMMSFFTSTAAR